MKKGYLRLIIFLSVLILFYAFFFIFPRQNNINILMMSTMVFAIIAFFYLNYEKTRHQNQNVIIATIIIFAFIYYSITYLLAFRTGLVRTGYSLKLLSILKNAVPVLLLIGATEFMRYLVITKGSKYKTIYVLSLVAFVMIDCLIDVNSQAFIDNQHILAFIAKVVFPSITKNILLLYIIRSVGYTPAIIYRIIFEITAYVLPFFPNFDDYLQACLDIISPLILLYFIYGSIRFMRRREKQKVKRKSRAVSILLTILTWSTILITVALSSGLFKYQTLTIGSGSMYPNIDKGDIIIVEKMKNEEMQNIQEGEVLVSKQENKIIAHRIVSITDSSDGRLFSTKGDANQSADGWVTYENQIIGVARFKIPLLGWPSVWLQEDFLKQPL